MDEHIDNMTKCEKCGYEMTVTGYDCAGCIKCKHKPKRVYAAWGHDKGFKYKWIADLVMWWDLLIMRFR